MKQAWILPVALLCALPARGDQVQLPNDVKHALTPIDSLPTVDEIENVFPQPNTVAQLANLANDPDESHVDFGVRLRAIRTLPLFCPASCAGSVPHQTLVNLLAGVNSSDQAGKPVLLLRAIIESIGAAKSGASADVTRLVPFLEHPNRDIRAATAFALRDICNQAAVTPLRNRYNLEMGPTGVAQVRFAISEALRDLGTCSP
jgi:HEAT repeat protein